MAWAGDFKVGLPPPPTGGQLQDRPSPEPSAPDPVGTEGEDGRAQTGLDARTGT